MILLDPDLHPGSRAESRTRTRSGSRNETGAANGAAGRENSTDNLQIPSVRALTPFLKRAQAAVRLRGEVSVLLTTDAAIRKLNRQFRGKNKATDVLSFPAENLGGEKLAGDLAISLETAQTQAAQHGHALAMEVKILILHGLLHLNGFDHERDAGEMAREEQKLRARLGLEHGLIERVEGRRIVRSEVGRKSKDEVRRKSKDEVKRKSKDAVRRKSKDAPSLVHPGFPTLAAGKNRRNGARRMAR